MSKILDWRDEIKYNLKNRGFVFYVVFLLVVSVVSYASFYVYKKYIETSNENTVNSEVSAETSDLVSKVGKLILLPKGEVPTIATVSNLALLKGQDFFVDATVGDKVLIYKEAKKAILYNPNINKIITVAPLVVDEKAVNKNVNIQNNTGGMLQY